MAMIDVEGRQAKNFQGKARWCLTKCNDPGNTLTFSELGLAPSDSHLGTTGARAQQGRKYIATRMAIPDPRSYGKRHIDCEHGATDKDAAKRAAGRFGLKKVAKPERSGKDDLGGMRPVTAGSRHGNETSEQRATRSVERFLASLPAEAAASDLRKAQADGGHAVLAAEARLRKMAEVEASRQRDAAAKPARSRSADFSQHASLDTPFATNKAVQDATKHVALRKAVPQPTREAKERAAKRTLDMPGVTKCAGGKALTPFDTVGASDVPYPEPPAIGIKQTAARAGKKQLGLAAEPSVSKPNSDHDSVALRKAAAPKRLGGPQDKGMPDFIFGAPEVANKPRRFARGATSDAGLLDHQASAGPPKEQAKGRFHEQKHKPTALW